MLPPQAGRLLGDIVVAVAAASTVVEADNLV